MKKLKILTGVDNTVLRTISAPIVKFDSKLKKFVKQMREAMTDAKGIGIAAPQVGLNIRVFLMTFNYGKKDERIIVMANPKILNFSEESIVDEEGCLSLPGVYGNVERSRSVIVEFYDVEGIRYEMNLSELNAREVQHELDHLDAILFVDRVKEKLKE